MKKVFSTLLMVFTFAAWAQGTKGYFEQDARKSSNLLVYESTVENGREDGSDFYVADVLRKAVITDLQIYSNYQIIDFYDNDTHKKITAKNPEIKTPAEAAAAVNAKYAVSIKTIIDRTQPPESYKIELSLHLIQEDQVINGYTSSIPWTRDEYLEYAHSEAVFNLLPQIDITLTPLGERLLLNTKTPEMSLEDAKQEEDDINLQLNRTSRKENSVNAQKKVKAQLAQAKERVRKLTKKLQQDEDEKLADQKRSDKTKQRISETLSKTRSSRVQKSLYYTGKGRVGARRNGKKIILHLILRICLERAALISLFSIIKVMLNIAFRSLKTLILLLYVLLRKQRPKNLENTNVLLMNMRQSVPFSLGI